MDREPQETTRTDEPARPTPQKLACVLPFLLGVAVALVLLVLFYYLLLAG